MEGHPRNEAERQSSHSHGGNRGIGKAVALELAAHGADVAFNYRRDEESARETVAEIEGLGRRALARQADVTDSAAVEAMVSEATEAFGVVDILVCNAGVASRGNPLGETDQKEMRRVLDVHLFGALHFARALLPGMRERSRADVHFISSTSPFRAEAGHGPYATAKACLERIGDVDGKGREAAWRAGQRDSAGPGGNGNGQEAGEGDPGRGRHQGDIPGLPVREGVPAGGHSEAVGVSCVGGRGYISGHVIHLDGGMAR